MHMDLDRIVMIARNDIGGTSTKNLLHWYQMAIGKKFQQFDYGGVKNMQVYGRPTPPEIDMG